MYKLANCRGVDCYLPAPVVRKVVQTSQEQGQSWRYTTSKPSDDWQQEGFDDSDWKEGKGGFGTEGTPGAVVGTEWKDSGIFLRRTFEKDSTKHSRPQLLIHYDEDAEVYINGQLVAKLEGYTSSYVQVRLDEKAQKALKVGSNCLAVHCRQTKGGQYIDVGLVDMGAYECQQPSVITVEIDIKPGSYPNAINLGSYGLVPVAILSSAEFDARTVDADTVQLAGVDVAVRGKGSKSMAHEEDVNEDGLVDLVVQVGTENLNAGSFQDGGAFLTGKLLEEFGATPIQGWDEITIVPPEQ